MAIRITLPVSKSSWPTISLCLLVPLLGIGNRLIAQPPARPSAAGNPRLVQPKDRITDVIDDRATVVRSGNRHPMARPEFDTGMVANDFRMNRMILAIESDADQQPALESPLQPPHQPHSPLYQTHLTPPH